jgi:hypothetical protein
MSSCIVGVVNKNDLEKYDIYAGSGYQSLAGFEVEVWTCNGFVPVTDLIMPPLLRTPAG